MLEVVYIILVAIVSSVIAANNSADSVGTLYGSGLFSYRKAALYSGIFVMLGIFLEGHKMEGAIGGGIVTEPFTLQMSLIVLLSTFILMLIFTFLSIPLAASQILVGSITAVAFSYRWIIHTSFLSLVLSSWILTLAIAIFFAYLLYHLLAKIATRMHLFSLSKFYTISLYIGSAFIAYTLGANTIGLVASLNLSSYSIFIAAIFSLIGTYFLGRKTVRTAGEKIVSLDPSRAFAAQISGALIVEIFTQMHLPVSITQAVIGGIIGTGLVKGYRELNRKTLKNLAISWVLAPILSFLLTLGIIMLSFSL